MNDDDPIDLELRASFHSLREQVSGTAPSFDSLTRSLMTRARKRLPPMTLPLAAAAMIGLVALPLLVIRQQSVPSLSSSLPVLFPTEAGSSALFAGRENGERSPLYPSDQLLPYRINLKL